MFFALAVVSALVGAFLFRRGLLSFVLFDDHHVDLGSFMVIPRLIPFAAAAVSTGFGLVYFVLEKYFKRRLDTSLALVHLGTFVIATMAYATFGYFMWRALVGEHPTYTSFPLWPMQLAVPAGVLCCLTFVANISWSVFRSPLVASNPR